MASAYPFQRRRYIELAIGIALIASGIAMNLANRQSSYQLPSRHCVRIDPVTWKVVGNLEPGFNLNDEPPGWIVVYDIMVRSESFLYPIVEHRSFNFRKINVLGRPDWELDLDKARTVIAAWQADTVDLGSSWSSIWGSKKYQVTGLKQIVLSDRSQSTLLLAGVIRHLSLLVGAAGVGVLAISERRHSVRYARFRRRQCMKCGYPRGTADRCPECGTEYRIGSHHPSNPPT